MDFYGGGERMKRGRARSDRTWIVKTKRGSREIRGKQFQNTNRSWIKKNMFRIRQVHNIT